MAAIETSGKPPAALMGFPVVMVSGLVPPQPEIVLGSFDDLVREKGGFVDGDTVHLPEDSKEA